MFTAILLVLLCLGGYILPEDYIDQNILYNIICQLLTRDYRCMSLLVMYHDLDITVSDDDCIILVVHSLPP